MKTRLAIPEEDPRWREECLVMKTRKVMKVTSKQWIRTRKPAAAAQKGDHFWEYKRFYDVRITAFTGSLRDQRESHHHRFVKRRQSGVSGSSAGSAAGAGALLGSGARREESSDDEVVSVDYKKGVTKSNINI